ncbi:MULTISPECIES: pseudaminic acid synthase [Arcobacteraceae]|uniref:Pseudaminic acid synthase n=2 Tax=Arcobacteraceae TaxID=2808963 RepID=A0A5C2HF37_9BACT|nr:MULTISPECIES: pseudaminic acid synthase [Arcobacteraceae]OCL83439.1 Pseudaminic acid synthase [Arcobacter porcinus]OCL94472.1 Pseudaminic acid synthase [Aliarcobacter thereius]OCL95134.1 Pseudaminic acid synthase [Aliarcobacter thereius LMG 24486]QBF16876.1 pseudaminic acid synthase [Aliarcobacter thereius LMG 24486]QEP41536.1 pseudaminic acid synthase [Arcobacter porcinus]
MKIGKFDLNKDGTYIIAELSANHNGSLEVAKETIKAAKEIGANAIKLQTYRADTMTINSNNEDFMISGGTLWDGKNLYELYEEAYTPWEWHKELFDYARSLDIDIFSTPFDKSAVDFLEQFNPSAYKIASFEITDYELVKYTASKGKPIIISTGIATIDEIQDVVNICKSVGNEDIILLKCTSEYPAKLEEANLKTIQNMKETFGVEVGFSDHTMGHIAPVVAVTLGAKIIEKHFIIDKSIGGADADFSLDKKEFEDMIKAVRDSEKLLGKVEYSLNEKRTKQRRFARSLYISKDIKKGEIFNTDNIRSVRPGYGLHPKYLNDIIGKVSKKDYKFGDRLEMF